MVAVPAGPVADHLAYAALWAAFGLIHSLLAAEPVKRRLRARLGARLAARYRLAYNAVAVVTLAAVLLAGGALLGDRPAWPQPGWAWAAMLGLQIGGSVLMAAALRGYDLDRLAGTAQLRQARRGGTEPEDEPLRLDGLHRYVRHPLYLGGLLLLWGGARDPFGLATALWGSLYLAIGAWLEERKLLRLYGRAYADYRKRVPAVLPWRGRAI